MKKSIKDILPCKLQQIQIVEQRVNFQISKMTYLKEGDKAPDFTGLNEKGETVTLSDFKGKKLVLFFYPQDNTPTCTDEACSLRDGYSELKKQGFELLGVSPDTMKKHQNFIKKYKLPFPLIADTERKMIEAYGVWGEKQLFGRKYMGVIRTTFVIDAKGKIQRIISKVDKNNHAKQILEATAN